MVKKIAFVRFLILRKAGSMFAVCAQPSCVTMRSQCAQFISKISNLKFAETSKAGIIWIANVLWKRWTQWELSNIRRNGVNGTYPRPVDTHWHVGEEIAAAEKEALPEAEGSYRSIL